MALVLPQAARAQSLFVNSDGGQFGTLNVSTGAYARLGTTTFNGTTVVFGGLANSANGNLYGLESNIFQDSTSAAVLRMFQVNRTNGTLALVGAVSTFTNGNRAGYASIGNTSDGTLYAIYTPSLFGTNSTLYTLNPASAAATTVGTTGFRFDGGLNGDGVGGLFMTGGEFNSSDYRLSRTTGAATLLQANAGAGNVYATGFTNNALYALRDNGGVFILNTTTGAASATGVTFNTGLTGLVLGAANVTAVAVPEPGTLALLGMVALPVAGVVLRRRRRLS